MAKRIVSLTSLTPTATADAANLANNTFLSFVQGGSATQTIRIVEIYLGGLASTSAPSIMLTAQDSTVAVNIGAGNCTDAPVDAATAALAAAVKTGNNISAGAVFGQRSATLHLHNLSFNAFGGIVRLNWPLDQQAVVVGNTANLGELSVSAFTGGTTGLMGFHLMYEPS